MAVSQRDACKELWSATSRRRQGEARSAKRSLMEWQVDGWRPQGKPQEVRVHDVLIEDAPFPRRAEFPGEWNCAIRSCEK